MSTLLYNDTLSYELFLTPIGEMLVAATDKGVCLLNFIDDTQMGMELSALEKRLNTKALNTQNAITQQAIREVMNYFNGDFKTFTFPLMPLGTDFQKNVWLSLMTIPYGETRSYSWQANAIGDSKAVRAVASANSKNKIAIVVPCHRVIGKNGQLTGYAGGMWRKAWLLNHEGHSQFFQTSG